MKLWDAAFTENPLIAILRGLEPDRAIEVADVLVNAGFRIIEVPLNSPEPLTSIRLIAEKYGDHIIVGAGTVLTADDVSAVVEAGGTIIVSPNLNPNVGARATELGAKWCPGVMTPTEAFSALDLGASVLKFSPPNLFRHGRLQPCERSCQIPQPWQQSAASPPRQWKITSKPGQTALDWGLRCSIRIMTE